MKPLTTNGLIKQWKDRGLSSTVLTNLWDYYVAFTLGGYLAHHVVEIRKVPSFTHYVCVLKGIT